MTSSGAFQEVGPEIVQVLYSSAAAVNGEGV